jgi:hypothetical protein
LEIFPAFKIISSRLQLKETSQMISEQSVLSFLRKGLRICRQCLSVLFSVLGGAILALVHVGARLFLSVWKRHPIPRPIAENAFTAKVFNAASRGISRLKQSRRAQIIGGAAAVISIH